MSRQLPVKLVQRRNIIAAAIVLFLGIVGLRFFQFQVIRYSQYAANAENNSIREVRLPAPRGIIYDRNGNFLVTNRPRYSLSVIPAEVGNSLDELENLDRYLDITRQDILQILDEAGGPYEQFQPIILYDDVSFSERSYLEEHRLEYPGIFFIDRTIRHYPSRARATHVIGYLQGVSADDYEQYRSQGYHLGDVVGASGVEKQYEQLLRGEDGYRYHLVDNLLRDLGEVTDKPTLQPVAGQDLQLTLDIELQALGERIMEGARGALIAMEPYTGEIYAYVSAPDYVLAPFTGPIPIGLWEQWRNHPDNILLDRVSDGLYPPGSIFKLVAVAAALASGQIDPADTVNCEGVYQFGNRTFHCNVEPGHGQVNMEEAIKVSCNIYFYKLIQWIGMDAWAEMADGFGFGHSTGIDLPQESIGLVPTTKYMDEKYSEEGWTQGHLLNLVLGQGDLLVTPLQIARMTAAIANGGHIVVPNLVLAPRQRDVRERVLDLSPSIWNYMQHAMYEVVNGEGGTGSRARVDGGDIYGKTGTAQNPHGEAHSWFSGFVKTEAGRVLTVTVLVEQGGFGSRTAAPLAAEIFQLFMEKYGDDREDLAQIR